MDKEVVGNDKFMGKANINFLDWIAKGSFAGTIDIEDKSGKHAGKIRLTSEFQRSEIPGVSTSTLQNENNANAFQELKSSKRDPNGDFSNDEICKAFQSFDLDENNYVGAAEIRHVLVNIGERVTDEEVRFSKLLIEELSNI